MTTICKKCGASYIKDRPLDKYIKDPKYKKHCFDCYEKITGKTYGEIKKELNLK